MRYITRHELDTPDTTFNSFIADVSDTYGNAVGGDEPSNLIGKETCIESIMDEKNDEIHFYGFIDSPATLLTDVLHEDKYRDDDYLLFSTEQRTIYGYYRGLKVQNWIDDEGNVAPDLYHVFERTDDGSQDFDPNDPLLLVAVDEAEDKLQLFRALPVEVPDEDTNQLLRITADSLNEDAFIPPKRIHKMYNKISSHTQTKDEKNKNTDWFLSVVSNYYALDNEKVVAETNTTISVTELSKESGRGAELHVNNTESQKITGTLLGFTTIPKMYFKKNRPAVIALIENNSSTSIVVAVIEQKFEDLREDTLTYIPLYCCDSLTGVADDDQ